MKAKHIAIRVQQCLLLAEASTCPRRKFGALLLDPIRNVVLMDGYNGGPRGAQGHLCGGYFCERNGLKKSDFNIQPGLEYDTHGADGYWAIGPGGVSKFFPLGEDVRFFTQGENVKTAHRAVKDYVQSQLEAYPGVKSGTHMEVGCHHAEMNVICNAAAAGVKTAGAWLIVTGEPCVLCAKLIHHAGITQVIVVGEGYMGPNGVNYLKQHGVEVTSVEGPKDPRLPSIG